MSTLAVVLFSATGVALVAAVLAVLLVAKGVWNRTRALTRELGALNDDLARAHEALVRVDVTRASYQTQRTA